MGTLVRTHVFRQRSQRLVVISPYQVVDIAPTAQGSCTTSSQQRSLLLADGDAVTDPRKAFQRDLSQLLTLVSPADILLLEDFNESFRDVTHGMSNLAIEHGLHDVMKLHHCALDDPPPTFARGKTRLDYALGTPRVIQAIRQTGYEPFNLRLFSDHRAFFVDLDAAAILSSEIQTMAPIKARGLRSKNVSQVSQYLLLKHRLLKSVNAFQRAKQLEVPGNRHRFAERLDRDMVKLSLAAGRRTIHFREPAWSIELHQQRLRVNALSKMLSMSKTGIDLIPLIDAVLVQLDSDINIPERRQECSIALREENAN